MSLIHSQTPAGKVFCFLSHPFGESLVVWFEKANQWVQFTPQQKIIFEGYANGLSAETIAGHLSSKTSALPLPTIKEMYRSLDILVEGNFPPPDFSTDADRALHHTLPRHKTHHYQYKGHSFSVRYASPFLESYMHLPFAHLEVAPPAHNNLALEVFPFHKRWALRINGSKCLTADESPQLKRLLYEVLSNFFFQKTQQAWLTRLHASAVEKDGNLIVLSSVSGAGKSTMAALLQQAGYRFFADDYIPVCRAEEKLYPFPALLCLKKGSWPVLEKEGVKTYWRSSYGAGYLAPTPGSESLTPLPLKNIIIIHWEKDAATTFTPVPPLQALQLFLQEAWVNSSPSGARQFIHWFSRLSFYRLHYSNNKEGVKALQGLVCAVKG